MAETSESAVGPPARVVDEGLHGRATGWDDSRAVVRFANIVNAQSGLGRSTPENGLKEYETRYGG
jgi:hypothetical protein